MEKILYNVFFDSDDGIFSCMRDNVACEDQKAEAKKLLEEANQKIKMKKLSDLEFKVVLEIIAELANCSDDRKICDFYMDVKKILTNAFLTLEEYERLKGE